MCGWKNISVAVITSKHVPSHHMLRIIVRTKSACHASETLRTFCDHYFLKRIPHFPDSAYFWEAAFAMVWRLLISVGDQHAFFHGHAIFRLPVRICRHSLSAKNADANSSNTHRYGSD